MVEELLDVLDPEGRPLGAVKPRNAVHRDGDWHKTVHVWIVNYRGEVLFQKRSMGKDSFPGLWDVSAAGHVSAGESVLLAAQRELFQEIGVRASVTEFHQLCILKSTSVQRAGSFVDNEFNDVFVIRRNPEVQDLALEPSEVDEVSFYSGAELERVARHSDPAVVPHPEEYERLARYLSK